MFIALHTVGKAGVEKVYDCAAAVMQGVVRAGMMTLPSRESFMASIGKSHNPVACANSSTHQHLGALQHIMHSCSFLLH